MADWRQIAIGLNATLGDAIAKIDEGRLQTALVVDSNDGLIGVVTDGDARRALLRGKDLKTSIREVMSTNPMTLSVGTPRSSILAFMREHGIHQVPIIDRTGRIVALDHIDDILQPQPRSNWVVLMAGGLGSRLLPLTEKTPKPMLAVGNKPILETILKSFIDQGFSQFFFSVNYKADAIQQYFEDGARWGAKIEYLLEDKRLGTAGALSLLPKVPTEPIIIMNGDVLTRANFAQILEHHVAHNSPATMVVREYETQIPFGVVTMDGNRIHAIVEKPIQRHYVNAGMYVLSPSVLKHVPKNTFFDMPSLFAALLKHEEAPVAFPLRDYWLDIGQIAELERAQQEWDASS
ncbi:MAG TPA: nucleotidyltransferase family protein [Rhizomicrobium sp.]